MTHAGQSSSPVPHTPPWQPPSRWLAASEEERCAWLATWFGSQAPPWSPADVAACRRWLAQVVYDEEVRLGDEAGEAVPGMTAILQGLARLEGAALPPYQPSLPGNAAAFNGANNRACHEEESDAEDESPEDDPEATADMHSVSDLLVGGVEGGPRPSKATRKFAPPASPEHGATSDGSGGQTHHDNNHSGQSPLEVPLESEADADLRMLVALVAGWRGEIAALRHVLDALPPEPDGSLPVASAWGEALARLIAHQGDVLEGLARAAQEELLSRICGWFFALAEAGKLAAGVLEPAWRAIVERLAYRREAGLALSLQKRFRASPAWPGIALPPAAPVAGESRAVPGRADATPWIEALEHVEATGSPEAELVTRLWQHAVLECDGRAEAEQLARLHEVFARLACRLDPSTTGLAELLGRLFPFRFAEPAVRTVLKQLPGLAGTLLPRSAGRVSEEVWQRLWQGLATAWRRVFTPEAAAEAELVWRLAVAAPDRGRLELMHRLLPALVRHLCTLEPAGDDPERVIPQARRAAAALVKQYGKLHAHGELPPAAPPYWLLVDQWLEQLERTARGNDGGYAGISLAELHGMFELLLEAPPLRISELAGAAEALNRAFRLFAGAAQEPSDGKDLHAWLVRFVQSEAPCLVLAALAACRDEEPLPAEEVLEVFLEALPARLPPAWWLPIPGSAYGLHVYLVEGLIGRYQRTAAASGEGSEHVHQRALLALWRRVRHDSEGAEAFVDGLAARVPGGCESLLRALLTHEGESSEARGRHAWLEPPGENEPDLEGARALDRAFAAAPAIWPDLLRWADQERGRQECVGRRFERTLAHLASELGSAAKTAFDETESCLSEHAASFTGALAQHQAWYAYLAAAEEALLTVRSLAEQVSIPLWRRLAETNPTALQALRETIEAHAAWGIVLREGYAWAGLLRISPEEADADGLMELAHTLWHDDPAGASTQARALASAAMDGPLRQRHWPWLIRLLEHTKRLPIDPWADLVEPALATLVSHRGSATAFLTAAQDDPHWRRFVGSRGTQAGWETLLAYDHSGAATVRLWHSLDGADRAAQAEPLLRGCLAQMDWTTLLQLAEAEPAMWTGHGELLLDGLLNRMDAVRGDLERFHSLLDAIRAHGEGWCHLTRLPGFWQRLIETTGGTGAEQILWGALEELNDLEEAAQTVASCGAALEAPEVSAEVREQALQAIRRAFHPAASRMLTRLRENPRQGARFRKLFEQLGIDTGRYL